MSDPINPILCTNCPGKEFYAFQNNESYILQCTLCNFQQKFPKPTKSTLDNLYRAAYQKGYEEATHQAEYTQPDPDEKDKSA